MADPSNASSYASADAKRMSLEQKKKYLRELTEDEFRDLCVRPLFESKGLVFLRDMCGREEEGKDCIFEEINALGQRRIIAVQTKRGNLTMAGTSMQHSTNVAANQLDMALKSEINLDHPQRTARPHQVILCASGLINEGARRYIKAQVTDNRISVFDADWLIPEVDEHIPEFWSGVDKNRFPYLRALRTRLLSQTDAIFIRALPGQPPEAPFTDEAYAPLYLLRVGVKPITRIVQKELAEVVGKPTVPVTERELEPDLQEFEAASILNSRETMILITGEGGSGKTTSLRRLAYKLIERSLALDLSVKLPVLLTASQVFNGPDELAETVFRFCREVGNTEALPFDMEDLQTGRLAILIDGLEELGKEVRIKSVVAKIFRFNAKYPRTVVITTTRPFAFLRHMPEFDSFARYSVTELSIANAAKIVNRSLRGIESDGTGPREIIRRLQDVHGLTLTPMLVTVFVAGSDLKKKDIPPNITEIFKKFTELMLGRWDDKKGLDQQYEHTFKDLLLRRIAFAMHAKRLSSVPLEEFRAVLLSEMSKRPAIGNEDRSEVVFDELVYRSNLLTVEDNAVSFRHPLLREFFAGRAVQDFRDFEGMVCDDWWRRAIVFYFGEHPDRHHELMSLAKASENHCLPDLYEAAVTIGLAAQACYFAETPERLASLKWVIDAMSLSTEDYLERLTDKQGKYPLTSFLYCYLLGRDAVASSIMTMLAPGLIPDSRPQVHPDSVITLEQFWCIAGLLEAGEVDQALAAVKKFNPEDDRLLLALDLGCLFISKLKVSSEDEKRGAKEIRKVLAPKTSHLRNKVLEEFRSQLLELRSGSVFALPSMEDDPEEGVEDA